MAEWPRFFEAGRNTCAQATLDTVVEVMGLKGRGIADGGMCVCGFGCVCEGVGE